MNTPGTNNGYGAKEPSRRVKGLVIVIALHALIGYALVSGLARKGLNLMKKPMEAVVIQEVIIPPPPPPPPPKKIETPKEMPKVEAPPPPYVPPAEVTPQVSTAPSIVSVATPPPTPAVIAPPPPPAPVVTGPRSTAIGIACPTQVPPEMPRQARQDGTTGVVKAQIHIKGGVIQSVEILSGPRVFHKAVKDAMMQYKCVTDGADAIVTQEFVFKEE